MIPPDLISIVMAVLASIGLSAQATQPAERGEQTRINAPAPPPEMYAPEGLSDCDEMSWYRVKVGLPARFDQLGWRESNCRNEDGVRTSCCHGYWQLWVDLHLKDSRMAPGYAACGVTSANDVNSDNPQDKLRQACATKVLYTVEGFSPWGL